ncbi:MAG: hypothetical protein ACR2PA_14560 [Hyphomicrobiaceae bacterium]
MLAFAAAHHLDCLVVGATDQSTFPGAIVQTGRGLTGQQYTFAKFLPDITFAFGL